MLDDVANIPLKNLPHMTVELLLDIMSWQHVQRDVIAQQMALTAGKPVEEAQLMLENMKVKYRADILKSYWGVYGPDLGSDLQKS